MPDLPPPPLPPDLPARATLRAIGAEVPVASPDDEDPREGYVLVARYRKARKISASLLAMGGDATRVEQLGRSDLGRQLAADRAGTRVPSPICWTLVVEMVREVRP